MADPPAPASRRLAHPTSWTCWRGRSTPTMVIIAIAIPAWAPPSRGAATTMAGAVARGGTPAARSGGHRGGPGGGTTTARPRRWRRRPCRATRRGSPSRRGSWAARPTTSTTSARPSCRVSRTPTTVTPSTKKAAPSSLGLLHRLGGGRRTPMMTAPPTPTPTPAAPTTPAKHPAPWRPGAATASTTGARPRSRAGAAPIVTT